MLFFAVAASKCLLRTKVGINSSKQANVATGSGERKKLRKRERGDRERQRQTDR